MVGKPVQLVHYYRLVSLLTFGKENSFCLLTSYKIGDMNNTAKLHSSLEDQVQGLQGEFGKVTLELSNQSRFLIHVPPLVRVRVCVWLMSG